MHPDGAEAVLPGPPPYDAAALVFAAADPAGTRIAPAGDGVLRCAPDGRTTLGHLRAVAPHPHWSAAHIGTYPGDALGFAAVTAGGEGDLLLASPDGGITVIEAGTRPVSDRSYRIGPLQPDVRVLGAAPAGPDGLTGLLAVSVAGELLFFPHSGVFWPQFPALAFLAPLVVAAGFDSYDIVG